MKLSERADAERRELAALSLRQRPRTGPAPVLAPSGGRVLSKPRGEQFINISRVGALAGLQ